jgi:hypothetical protein
VKSDQSGGRLFEQGSADPAPVSARRTIRVPWSLKRERKRLCGLFRGLPGKRPNWKPDVSTSAASPLADLAAVAPGSGKQDERLLTMPPAVPALGSRQLHRVTVSGHAKCLRSSCRDRARRRKCHCPIPAGPCPSSLTAMNTKPNRRRKPSPATPPSPPPRSRTQDMRAQPSG